MRFLFSALLAVIVLFMACQPTKNKDQAPSNTSPTASYQTLEPEDFAEKLLAYIDAQNAQLLDVRTPEEVAQGQIFSAQNLNFNAPDFKEQLAKLDPNKPTFVYCAVGGRSAKACQAMAEMGFKEVYNLGGGY